MNNFIETVVIARYNEDLSWIKNVSKEFDYFIINKGNDDCGIAPKGY